MERQLLNESIRYIFGDCLPLPAPPLQSLDGIILFISATGRGAENLLIHLEALSRVIYVIYEHLLLIKVTIN